MTIAVDLPAREAEKVVSEEPEPAASEPGETAVAPEDSADNAPKEAPDVPAEAPAVAVTTAIPPASPPPAEPPTSGEAAAPVATVTAALPEPKPERKPAEGPPEAAVADIGEASGTEAAAPAVAAPAVAARTTADDTAGSPDTADGAPAEEIVVDIPVVPPAPEQLAYWERYRQPFNMDDARPRIAVVMTGLGLSDSATEAAIKQLPAAVTLSFSPYARNLERWIALARARGHEVMLDLPMEPATFPNEDPGPQGLLTSLTAEDNLDRLDWVLSRGSAYVGLAGSMGSRFTASRQDMEPVMRDVKERGLIFLDRRTTENSVVPKLAAELGVPRAINNRSVDERQASRVAIDARLAQIERIALTDGYAVAMAQPYPVTLQRLSEWATELTARGFVIAPISALADQQKLP